MIAGAAKSSIQTTLPKYSNFVKLSNSAQSDLERISVLHLLTGEKPQDLHLRIGGGDCKIGISLEHFAFNRDEAFECIGQAIINARNVVNKESESAIQGELAVTALNNIGVNDTHCNTQDETQNQTQYDEDEEMNSQPSEERNYEKNQSTQNNEMGW
ncbi:hypothetical protein AX774_g5882 [Zancudomyces culisetae]|uniref:Uncharacterized protein n=1 Tax=Zancudomyces culisetae TaxID=1213189 RepID=A0A1R1PI95_ZANCU|nr:hypothetical protein AX774_g5882 [Zancudomyces culisetae]|eukprot:OMH80676.1 hypothetical protein AX774_g5882 [Zancudomyces culisetae]